MKSFLMFTAALVVLASSIAASASVSAKGPSHGDGDQRYDRWRQIHGPMNMNPELRELRNVQRAMDRYMNRNGLDQVDATPFQTRNFTNQSVELDGVVYPASPVALAPRHLKKSPTDCSYVWNSLGEVTQVLCD